jgi:hypothetical protein
MCLSPDTTRQVIAGIKSNPYHEQGNLTLCASFFSNSNVSKDDEAYAKELLQEIVSRPDLYITSYDYVYLRKFFIGSMSARKRYGK